ncbi:hypothetical protein FBZ93_11611 [Bradyrhizobium macuxiense]|uniref:Uncharacterized protein n=1 Tax=Bradyrhizobium macuxiense TaxID=1755647 RepID=A0A560L194_9BRAD|nr:hypothetical protein FBZ93_11611 [Bradyrhizobium macuxiense]
MEGWRKRHVDEVGWTTLQVMEEERHFTTLLNSKPTSVDDGGTRKRRQRAVEWFRKQGRYRRKLARSEKDSIGPRVFC